MVDAGSIREALIGRVRRYAPSWLRGEVDDLVQQAWIRVHEARERGERIDHADSPLVGRIAYCTVVDAMRRSGRRPEGPASDALDEHEGNAPGPERRVRSGEVRRALVHCLGKTTPERRRALTLFLLGHSGGEVAELLGWSSKKAENMVYRGLADLRACLGEQGVKP